MKGRANIWTHTHRIMFWSKYRFLKQKIYPHFIIPSFGILSLLSKLLKSQVLIGFTYHYQNVGLPFPGDWTTQIFFRISKRVIAGVFPYLMLGVTILRPVWGGVNIVLVELQIARSFRLFDDAIAWIKKKYFLAYSMFSNEFVIDT